jgi:hypothetical protein
MSRLARLVFALLSGLMISQTALAQDVTPEPGTNAASQLPEASTIGSEWMMADPVSPDVLAPYSFEMSPDVFSEGAATTYLGPTGSRILIINLILTDNRVAVRKSWEDATGLLDYLNFGISEDYDRTRSLETMDPPVGCVEAKRMEGVQGGYLTPVGATMCAVDPDRIVLVFVDGTFNDLSGIEASDAVIGLVIP